jgi:hypothetical protein
MVSATDPHGRILGFLDRRNIFYIMTNDLLLQTMALTKTDPSSRRRGRPTKTRP